MQTRRPERIRPGEVVINFTSDDQAEINKQILKQDGVKFRTSSKRRIFLPDKETETRLIEGYLSFPLTIPIMNDDGSIKFGNILIEKDDYYIDDDGIQMINERKSE